jgi:hypothetical protein
MQPGLFVDVQQTLFIDSLCEQSAFREVPVESGLAYAGVSSDAIQRHVGSFAGEELGIGRDDRLAVALGVASSGCG